MRSNRYLCIDIDTETMNRDIYIKMINTLLNVLKGEIKESGKLNLLDVNVHAEDFYRDLLNIVSGWQLRNLNQWNQNAAGVDLWYEGGHIVVQVTSTATKDKIQSSIDKLSKDQFSGYRFKFLRINGDVRKLRKEVYATPEGIAFDPASDIIDISTLLKDIANLEIGPLKAAYDLCVKEIVPPRAPVISETDLAEVVKALATSVNDWRRYPSPVLFDVEKKIAFNHLENRERIINDYKLYIGKLNAVYEEFLASGNDYGFIILHNLSDCYSRNVNKFESNDLFDVIVSETCDAAMKSSNSVGIHADRIAICVNVIVVDAFIRCRIFEDPEGYRYVDA